jgi:UDP-N-acetylmuramoyl-tripeptide--D-alanyl-D-alanine ligase
MQLPAHQLADAVGASMEGLDVIVDGASIDSRELAPGNLFVPVVAERDGHEFVTAALAAGAVAYLTEGPRFGGTALVVDDTTEALQRAGRHARTRLPDPVIGITGSVGKTSVKDLLASVLRQRLRTAASVRSFNNELGVPLTLLNAADDTEATVVELGARGVGHIAALCAIASPTVGIVTRVAAVHTELFGTIDEVARAKGELVEALPDAGTAVLNAADPRVLAMAGRTAGSVVTYGEGGDVRATDVEVAPDLRTRFVLESPWGRGPVELAVAGRHQADNALAAAAAALACGLDFAAVQAGLATAELSPWRMEVGTAPSGATIVNDAYNANPTSVRAALDALADLPGAARRVAVLGVMAELGPDSGRLHAEVAAEAASRGIRVVAVDAPAYGVDPADAVPDVEAALARLGALGDGDAVLVKGSRVAALERVATRLLAG